ncbi:MAG: hypothetical protein Q4P23_01705 [Micrococcaceae bacterium]|nr:hypothetical protein [Micrococcaceae bacterium]
MTLAPLAALVGTLGYGAGSIQEAAGAVRAPGLSAVLQPINLVGLGGDGLARTPSLMVVARTFLAAHPRGRDGIAIGAVSATIPPGWFTPALLVSLGLVVVVVLVFDK